MGEKVKMSEYKATIDGGSGCEKVRVLEWEVGLPSGKDLAPLCQILIPPDLASAFRISPQQRRTVHDVNRASETTLSSFRNGGGALASSSETVEEDLIGSDLKKPRKPEIKDGGTVVSEDRDTGMEDPTAAAGASRTALKRQRLVWTSQLHKRFLDVVGNLGVKNAVPKTIMQMMNVEGLTRENVASHLQKYRIYLKQKQGFSDDATSPFSAGVDVSSRGGGHAGLPFPVPYGGPMMPLPVFGHRGMHGFNHHHDRNHGDGPYRHHHNHGHDAYHQHHTGVSIREERTQRL